MKLAALRVAALGPADRAWILARLGHQERERLLAQLSALDKLGAARLGADLAQVSADAGAAPAPLDRPAAVEDPPTPALRESSTGIGRASAEHLRAVLAELPAPCADIVADSLPPGRRHLLDSNRAGAPGPAHATVSAHLAAALVQVVERRLAATAEADGASAPPPAGNARPRAVQA